MEGAEHMGRSFHRKGAKNAKVAKEFIASFAFFAPWRLCVEKRVSQRHSGQAQ
jgi:hypothetical protein